MAQPAPKPAKSKTKLQTAPKPAKSKTKLQTYLITIPVWTPGEDVPNQHLTVAATHDQAKAIAHLHRLKTLDEIRIRTTKSIGQSVLVDMSTLPGAYRGPVDASRTRKWAIYEDWKEYGHVYHIEHGSPNKTYTLYSSRARGLW